MLNICYFKVVVASILFRHPEFHVAIAASSKNVTHFKQFRFHAIEHISCMRERTEMFLLFKSFKMSHSFGVDMQTLKGRCTNE